MHSSLLLDFLDRKLVQLLYFAFILLVCLFMLNSRIHQFVETEQFPGLQYHYPQKGTDQVEHLSFLDMSLYVVDFSEFDLLKGKFTFDGVMSFKFDPSRIPIELVDKFQIYNGEITKKSQPKFLYDGEYIIVSFNIEATFTQMLDFKYFPLADHNLYIIFKNEDMNLSDFNLYSSLNGLQITKNLEVNGWTVAGTNTYRGYFNVPLNDKLYSKVSNKWSISYPATVFEIRFNSPGLKNVMVIFLPGYVIFIFNVFLFFTRFQWSKSHRISLKVLSEDTKQGIEISFSCLTGLVVYRFFIETVSPTVSYFTVIDYFFVYFLIFAFIVYLYNVLEIAATNAGRLVRLSLFYASQFFLLLLVMLTS